MSTKIKPFFTVRSIIVIMVIIGQNKYKNNYLHYVCIIQNNSYSILKFGA